MDESVVIKASQLLKDKIAAVNLAEKGYSVFPFLEGTDIETLTRYYFEVQKEQPDHFYSSTHSNDFVFRKKTNDFIKEIILKAMPVHFKNYRLLGGAFVVKPAHGKGILQPHQDWNIVDETITRSYNLWIPLTDVNVENGAVFVLPGSHAKLPTYRGPGISSLFKSIEQHVWKTLTPLPMKAGDALFYDHALLHGSPVNTTDKIRLGIVCGVIAKDAEMQLCFPKNNQVEIYKADEHFFMEKDPMAGPADLTFIKFAEPGYTILSKEQFDHFYLVKKRSLLKRIFGIH